MYTDPIADLLTRIRNATKARQDNFTVPHSNVKMGVLKILQAKKFINEFNMVKKGNVKEIKVILSPERGSITLKRISKPGQRIYIKTTQLKKVRGGLGTAIISTPRGVISGEEAQKLKVGGELICEVY